MRTVTLQQVKNDKYSITIRSDGARVTNYEFNCKNINQQRRVAADWGIKIPELLANLESTGPAAREWKIEPPATPVRSLVVRTVTQSRVSGTKYDLDSWRTHVTGSTDTLMDWEDRDELCCLDIDYHGNHKPTDEWITTTLTTRLVPRPALWHLSRSGGVHAFYPRVGNLTGAEIASLAAIRWKSIDPGAVIELKTQVRCAGGATIVTPPGYETTNSFVTEWLGVTPVSSDDERIQDYLESHGFQIGQRYNHDHCPIEAGVATTAILPVVVGEDGIYCHRCAGHGIGKTSKPGYVPWSSIIGLETAGVMRLLVHNRSHWGHAKWVIEGAYGLTDEIARLGYSAAIKLYHGSECPAIFNPDLDILTRMPGRWANVADNYTFKMDGIKPLLSCLPVVIDGTTDKPRASTITRLEQPTLDHSGLGYPAVEVVRGIKIAGYRNSYRDPHRIVVAVPPKWLRGYGSAYFPRYRKGDVKAAEVLLESVLPNIHWPYVRALIVARGCNEARIGKPQHLLVTGVSGAAKTSHVFLAAGICGDNASEIQFEKEISRFRAAIREASENGGFVVVNEFLKDSLRQDGRVTAEQVLDPLLNLTPDSLSHRLFHGPTPLGNIGVMVWTEAWIPETLRDHLQIARRVHYLKLTKRLEWEEGLAAHMLSRIELVRTISPDHSFACDTILSDIIDRYFQVLTPFEAIAPDIGITTLEKSEEFTNPNEKLRRFFDLVCAAPPLNPDMLRKFPGDGYKLITRADDGELADLWSDFADGQGPKQWLMSQRLVACEWGSVLGVTTPVALDIKQGRAAVAVRFRQGKPSRPDKVNGDILKCE